MAPDEARRRLSTAAAVLTVLLPLGCIALAYMADRRLAEVGRPDLQQMGGAGVAFLGAIVSASLVAAFLLIRRPGHPIGWCFAGLAAAVSLPAATQGYGLLGLVADPSGSHPGAAAAAVIASSMFVWWFVAIGLICLLTPTGRYLSTRWAWCGRLLWGSGGVWFVTIVLMPVNFEAPLDAVQNPWGVAGLESIGPLRTLAAVLNNLLALAAFASLVVRYRRAVGEERRQLLWLGVLVIPVPVLAAVTFGAARTGNDAVLNLAAAGLVCVFPIGVGLAVAKTRLYDVDRILSRAVSYLLLSAVLAGTYAGTVLLVGQGFGGARDGSTISVALATLAVAVLAKPAHRSLQDAVDKRFSRRRYDALQVVRAHVVAPDPSTSVEQVLRDALHAPELSVSYWVQERAAWVTGDGRPAPTAAYALTVRRAGRTVARVAAVDVEPEIVAAVLREAEPELDNAGLRAAVAVQLEEVRASRARLATAQLEERRRVERDLHDGAQQRLLALAAQFQAALLNGDPARLREALATGVEQSQAAVRELRELANGLHPSVLADGGLSAALDDLASRHRIRVFLAEPDRRYPARVEATAWFIACEAVTNAVKHAAAEHVDVHVTCADDELEMVIQDDGLGGADPSGGGLRGLADRAEAVGGRLLVSVGEPQGTTVRAVLPCGS